MIALHLVIFGIGLLALYLGAKWLVTGSSSLALRFGIRPLIIGITVVALATSMPEFVVNLVAAITGEDSLALGNIVGSNISNIGLILGVSALVVPLSVSQSTLRKEYPIMMAVMIVFYVVAIDGTISKLDGGVLVAGLIGFFLFLIMDSRRLGKKAVAVSDEVPDTDHLDSMTKRVGFVLAGMLGLSLGARTMVYAAVYIAEQMSIEPIIIGLTVVAIGTSLPELAASLACVMNKQVDMSVGNVIGSNLLNVLFVVGLVSMIRPLHVDAASIDIHLPVMLAFSLFLLPVAWIRNRISRFDGTLLLLGFLGYMGYLIYLISPGS